MIEYYFCNSLAQLNISKCIKGEVKCLRLSTYVILTSTAMQYNLRFSLMLYKHTSGLYNCLFAV